MSTVTTVQRGFTIVRRLEAPRELVFQAWTDPDHLQWFAGMPSAASPPPTVDLRIGGAWRMEMVESEHKSYMTGGIYREIVAPERLVFSWGATDGWPLIDPTSADDVPLVTLTFNDLGGATEMIFELGFADRVTETRVRDWFTSGIVAGWTDTINRLSPSLVR